MKRNWNENAALRGAWRRIFSRSPLVIEVLNEGRRTVPRYKKDGERHKVDEVQFQCQVCDGWYMRKNIAVDHIIPVIAVENVTGHVDDWNVFHDRLFCEKKNLQRICDTCHDKKTYAERMARNTIKYNLELDELEESWNAGELLGGDLKKLLRKYAGSKKPALIRDRAVKFSSRLDSPLKKKRRKRR